MEHCRTLTGGPHMNPTPEALIKDPTVVEPTLNRDTSAPILPLPESTIVLPFLRDF